MPGKLLSSVDGTLVNPKHIALATPQYVTSTGVVFDLTMADGSHHQTHIETPQSSFAARAAQPISQVGPQNLRGQVGEARSILAAAQSDMDYL